MNTNVVLIDQLPLASTLEGAALEREGARWLEQMAASINTYAGLLENYQQTMLAYAFAVGDMLNNVKETGKRLGLIPHGEFEAWCERNVRVKKQQYAKYMKLARQIPKVHREILLVSDESIRSVYALLASEEIESASPEASVLVSDDDQGDEPPPASPNPALEQPIAAESSEPSCEKSTPDEGDEPSAASPPATRVPSRPTVSGKNAAIAAWGDIGVQILGCFSDPHSRTSWNQLTEKRHGMEVAKFALAYFDRAGVQIPTNAVVKSPNARLVLPWLNSPFADEYDLKKPAGFQKLRDNIDIIERACRPFFQTHGYDKANACFDLFRREYMRPAELARQAKVAALRERERKVVNVENHPAILVYGVELWPDGDLPEHLRLSYEHARWAYRIWFSHDAFFTRAEREVIQRASFWYCHQADLNTLKFPDGDVLPAISHFWWRAGQAMKHHPEDGMKSFCQMSVVKYT